MLASRFILILSLVFASINSFASDNILLTLEDKDGFTKSFTRAELEALPQVKYKTSIPWTTTIDVYEGPRLNDVVSSFPQPIEKLQIFAIDDYSYPIEAKSLERFPFFIALKKNGKPMKLRDKGPLWILLPFDQNPKLLNEEYLVNMCVWQLNKIKSL